jgi:hypothetical protein
MSNIESIAEDITQAIGTYLSVGMRGPMETKRDNHKSESRSKVKGKYIGLFFDFDEPEATFQVAIHRADERNEGPKEETLSATARAKYVPHGTSTSTSSKRGLTIPSNGRFAYAFSEDDEGDIFSKSKDDEDALTYAENLKRFKKREGDPSDRWARFPTANFTMKLIRDLDLG